MTRGRKNKKARLKARENWGDSQCARGGDNNAKTKSGFWEIVETRRNTREKKGNEEK